MRRRIWTTMITVALMSLLTFLMFGCAPCCPWSNFDWNSLKDLKNLSGGTVKGTAYIKTDTVEPVPGVPVEIGTYKTTTDDNGEFEIKNIPAGTYKVRIYGGDLGYTGTVKVTSGQTTNLGSVYLHPTLPPPDETGYPSSAEGVIRAYYEAINDKDYEQALTYLTGKMGDLTADGLRASYEPYIKSVTVTSIDRTPEMDYQGRSMYSVTFSAEYIKQYPAGNGNLPTVHSMIEIDGFWKIYEIGTG